MAHRTVVEETLIEAQQMGHYDIAIEIAKQRAPFGKSLSELLGQTHDDQSQGYLEYVQVLTKRR